MKPQCAVGRQTHLPLRQSDGIGQYTSFLPSRRGVRSVVCEYVFSSKVRSWQILLINCIRSISHSFGYMRLLLPSQAVPCQGQCLRARTEPGAWLPRPISPFPVRNRWTGRLSILAIQLFGG